MKSHEVIKQVFQKSNPKQIAAETGLSLSLVYKWAEPAEGGSGAPNPLDRVETLIKNCPEPLAAQWVCERSGGFFVKNPTIANADQQSLIPITNEIVQEFADMLAVIATSAIDNVITEGETKSIRARWEELKTVTETFVRCCEEGSYKNLNARIGKFGRT